MSSSGYQGGASSSGYHGGASSSGDETEASISFAVAGTGDTTESSEEKRQPSPDPVLDCPAPEGWLKKFTPKKDRIPGSNEILYISPTGEEIKNQSQLEEYLSSHPGGPSLSEFDWDSRTFPSPFPPKNKQERKSSPNKGKREEKDGKDDVPVEKEGDSTAESKCEADVEMKEAENVVDELKEVNESTEVSVDKDATESDSMDNK